MISVLAVLLSLLCIAHVSSSNSARQPIGAAFAPPLGIGAVLFKPNVKIVKSEGDEERLVDAGKFFVDAFW